MAWMATVRWAADQFANYWKPDPPQASAAASGQPPITEEDRTSVQRKSSRRNSRKSKRKPTKWINADPFIKDLEKTRNELISPTVEGEEEAKDIILVGERGGGKSSFVNSVLTIAQRFDRGTIKNAANVQAGDCSTNVTTKIKPYGVGRSIRVWDVPGIDVNMEPRQYSDFLNMLDEILDGKPKQGNEFCGNATKSYFPRRKFGLVILVISADKLSGSILGFYKRLVDMCGRKDVLVTVALTRVDLLCGDTANDITQVFCSDAIGQRAQEISETIGMSKKFILPVQNYTDEGDRNENMEKLLLHCLGTTLRRLYDFLETEVGLPDESDTRTICCCGRRPNTPQNYI